MKIEFTLFFALILMMGFLSTNPFAQQYTIKWDFKSQETDNNGTPSTKVVLLVNQDSYELAVVTGNVYEINKTDFKDYNMPKRCVIACQSWWAGSGSQFFVIKKNNSLVVMTRDIEEGNPDHPSDYFTKSKTLKTISIE